MDFQHQTGSLAVKSAISAGTDQPSNDHWLSLLHYPNRSHYYCRGLSHPSTDSALCCESSAQGWHFLRLKAGLHRQWLLPAVRMLTEHQSGV